MSEEKQDRLERGKIDAELVRRTMADDNAAFAALMDHYTDIFYKLVGGYVHDQHIAQDIIQEGKLQILLSLKSLQETDKFGSWAYTIMRRECIHTVKNRKRQPVSESELTEQEKHQYEQATADRPEVKEPVDSEFPHGIVKTAVYRLPEKYREVAILYYFDKLDWHQIAKMLNITPENAAVRLHRAKLMLRKKLRGLK